MPFNKPDITQLSALGSTAGDVFFPETKLLLPFDGTNGATATDDLSNLNNVIAFGGNASLSTARSKFGGSSCHFDGTGDYVDIAPTDGGTYWTAGAAIDSGDFTVEFWLNVDTYAGAESSMCWISNYGTNVGGWGIYQDSSAGKVYWWHYNGSAWVYLNLGQGTRTALSVDTWYHLAVTRSGSAFRMFLNGTQEDSMTDSNDMSSSNGGVQDGIRLGTINAVLNYPVNGYLSDLRITKGVARYTSNFTAPTTAFSTSAGDINKQILINSTADGVAIGTAGINQARIAKAWVNFDGSGTVAIRGSYNVSSITDTNTGNYRVNFSTAMADTNYCALVTTDASGGQIACHQDSAGNYTTSVLGLRIYAGDTSWASEDTTTCTVLVFGN